MIEPEYGSLDGEPYFDMEDSLTNCLTENMPGCNGTGKKLEKAWKEKKVVKSNSRKKAK